MDFEKITINNQNIKRSIQILKNNFETAGAILSMLFIKNTLNAKTSIQIIQWYVADKTTVIGSP
jgi:hypothetical protein